MRGVKVKKKKSCLWMLAATVTFMLYFISVLAAFKFFGEAIYSETHPGVSVSNMNIKQNQKLAFPSFQLCSLPREHLHPLKCHLMDTTPPGQHHIGELAPTGSKCEFKVDFTSPDGKVMCYRIDPHFNASSAGRFSSVLISLGIGNSGARTHPEEIDAFKGVDGLLLKVFDKHEQPAPFGGSVVLPIGLGSEVGMSKHVMQFPISKRQPIAEFQCTSTFSPFTGHVKGELYDKDNNFDLKQVSATRFYYNTLVTSIQVEVNEYEFMNALGDSSGISGFLVGFAFWGGPALSTAIWTGCGGRDISLFG